MSVSNLDKAFNISILYLTPLNLRGLGLIDTLDTYDVNGEFSDRGLYSIDYFGPVGDLRRSRRLAYIDIKMEVIHPLIYKSLVKLKGFYEDIILGKKYAIWNKLTKDFEPADALTGQTGFNFFLNHWMDIDLVRNKSTARNERVTFIENNKSKALTNKILVIPAGIRDMTVGADGRPVSDEINNIYRRLIGVSNTITEAAIEHNPELFDNSRLRLQLVFNELYEYITQLLKGKKKLITGKLTSRRIHNGTSNVISAYIPTVKRLGEPGSISVNNTIVGLQQFLVSIGQTAKYYIKNGPLKEVFISPDLPARLINKKTLEQEEVDISIEAYDYWMSNEGLDRVLSEFANGNIRHQPVEIEDHYVALIYKGPDNTFKIFYDIRELPANFSKKYVSPITLLELLYLSVYETSAQYPAFTTRYPVSGDGSIYPSFSYVKTTVKSEKRYPLNEVWQKDDTLPIAFEFPLLNSSFYDTLTPHTSRLAGLGADYDGDNALALIYKG
ncbi:MAG: hypothetical protein M0R77_00585 [Gammaproteobacteria bacterium]|nr:hypothetical protein [Acholeplasmataceae bacterium]MCK9529050.1 hypothetical protein [Gammaproteobacteria bacterium]